ncbi:response regulator [Cytophagaceae bacterium SJW1-29]|uniref:Response regulator n=2 Tax=Salmonirosea aquatica TaxID=2654236 RepID=A0A7C9FQZ3_9BACT|nr:response regulator [Cytophagaceae bacterium SJW1-29]
MQPITIAFVDDHRMLRQALVEMLQKNPNFEVVLEADNGRDFIDQLPTLASPPDLVLLDINMPVMNGYETALWLKKNHPKIKVVALSMNDQETAIIRMLNNGAKGYVLKDAEKEELYQAIERVMTQGFYYTDLVVSALSNTMHSPDGTPQHPTHLINTREFEFIKLACHDLTYKQIAEEMSLSPRTIDGYREALFDKLNVKSRVGLVMYAMRNGLVES